MTASLTNVLYKILAADVELILVGGLAAVAQGAPVTTFDVDIVHRRSVENVDKLMSVLANIHAYVREPTERRLPPSSTALCGPGHQLLMTDDGPLDCLGTIEEGLDYETLLPQTIEISLWGRSLRVASLATLVRLKEQWPDEESRLRAMILRRTLEG
ncbi:MAG: hypothetical protein H7Z43_15285 [Clostridia bacterium]|nr:hypothetical protein [Deltaproteobacteria bacterium]